MFFGQGESCDKVKTLALKYRQVPFFGYFKDAFFKNVPIARAEYMTVVGFLILRLHFLLENINPVNSQNAWQVITPPMREPVDKKLEPDNKK